MACALALLALCPYLVLATAGQFLMGTLESGLHTGPLGLSLVDAASNAAFALGALVSADLSQRRESHRLFLAYALAFVVGAAAAAGAPDVWVFGCGRFLMGAGAGLLLIGALPQLIRRYDAGHLPCTGLVVNVGLFSATVAGPTVGGLVAASGAWRALFVVLGAIGAGALLLGIPAFESVAAERPGLDVDRRAFALAVPATTLPFIATALLVDPAVPRWSVLLGVCAGAALLVVLLAAERQRESEGGHEPEDGGPDVLVPASLLGTAVPLVGILAASIGGLLVIALIELSEVLVQHVAHQTTGRGALLLLPLLAGLVLAAVVYRLVFTTRWVLALLAAGFVALIAGGLLLSATDPGHLVPLVPIAAVLLGVGAGATVSPGLFVTSLGVPSDQLARTFAAVELLRNEVTFAAAPVFLAVAGGLHPSLHPLRLATLGVSAVGALGGSTVLLVAASSALPVETPRLRAWLDGSGLGLTSPAPPGLRSAGRAGRRRGRE